MNRESSLMFDPVFGRCVYAGEIMLRGALRINSIYGSETNTPIIKFPPMNALAAIFNHLEIHPNLPSR
jgi:hypothetical protein